MSEAMMKSVSGSSGRQTGSLTFGESREVDIAARKSVKRIEEAVQKRRAQEAAKLTKRA